MTIRRSTAAHFESLDYGVPELQNITYYLHEDEFRREILFESDRSPGSFRVVG